MSDTQNSFEQKVGSALPGWTKRPIPPGSLLSGRYCRLEKLNAEHHTSDLHEAHAKAPDERDWTYLPYGPFNDKASFVEHIENAATQTDPLHYAIIDSHSNKAVGSIALMRIDSASGVIEVGHVSYSPLLQRTKAGTEAMYLLIRHVFDDLGYRRCEWKCDNLNLPSRRAAERYGFQYEGTFRQAAVYKGRSRDTAWFSIIDREWPALRSAFEQWLSPENFDDADVQRHSLSALQTITKKST
jgi:RimJ/RimL family protein N-acetyltransferase